MLEVQMQHILSYQFSVASFAVIDGRVAGSFDHELSRTWEQFSEKFRISWEFLSLKDRWDLWNSWNSEILCDKCSTKRRLAEVLLTHSKKEKLAGIL